MNLYKVAFHIVKKKGKAIVSTDLHCLRVVAKTDALARKSVREQHPGADIKTVSKGTPIDILPS